MIIIGANVKYGDGRTDYWFRYEPDIRSAQAVAKANNERNYCDRQGIIKNWFEFHDTETSKSWSIYGIGLSQKDYIIETEESFFRRIKQMALPAYDKTKRRKSFSQLPKGAYIIKILDAKEDKWPSGDACVKIAFDITEGEYAGFYQKMFDGNTNEDRKWPMDAVFTLNVPSDNSQDYVWTNWNTFFADLEDSNSGFVFKGDLKALKGKVIGGLFRIRQSSYNGNVYDHTELKWTRAADDVRSGNYGKLPNDKLVAGGSTTKTPDPNDFVSVPDGIKEELPF